MSKRSPRLYLEDIKSSIQNIEDYTREMTFEKFSEDKKTVDAVVRNLSIIGEAVNNLPETFKEKHSSIPWGEIIGMRNKAVHEYFGVDLEIIWKTVNEDLVYLKKKIKDLDFFSQ